MQLIQAQRDALLKPLSTVVGIVERRHTLPILANILIRKEGQSVSFIATDLEVQITTHANFGVGEEVDSLTVGARKLLDILRALPDSGDVRLSQTASKLTIQTGKSRFALQTLAAAEYPVVAQPDHYDASFSVAQKELKQLMSAVHFAMAQQDIRYYLNGMLLVLEPGKLHAVATDGHRLAHIMSAVEGLESTQEVIVPRKTVLEMLRLLDDSDQPVTIDVAPGQIRFKFGDVELVSKLVEGKFPDYKRVIPTNYVNFFDLPRDLLLSSLQRAAILTSEKFRSVRVQLGSNLLKISATNAEQEEAQEEIDIDYSHNVIDVGFNVSYLLDFLANTKIETIRWSVSTDTNASALLTIPENDNFQYVVMPMRI
jgi:DNA polymerase III subunit beta